MAQNKRLRTWEKYDQELEAARTAESAAELVENSGGSELGHVTITEMISPVAFWVQVPGSEKQIDHITERLAAMVVNPVAGFTAKMGEMCVAKFSADDAWYRAAVEARKGDRCTVRFIDFGNSEDVLTCDMRPVPSTVPGHSQIPAQAIEYKLAFIKVACAPLFGCLRLPRGCCLLFLLLPPVCVRFPLWQLLPCRGRELKGRTTCRRSNVKATPQRLCALPPSVFAATRKPRHEWTIILFEMTGGRRRVTPNCCKRPTSICKTSCRKAKGRWELVWSLRSALVNAMPL